MNGLVAVAVGCLEVRDDLVPPSGGPGPNEIYVRTAVSAVSPGTELRRLYDPSTSFPIVGGTGYMAAGRIEAVGAGVHRLRVGQRVMCAVDGCHRAALCLPADQAAVVPDALDWVDAACAYWIVPPYRALLSVAPRLWEDAAVVGLGPLGLCAVQLLRGLSRRLLAVDPITARRTLAERIGAHAACTPESALERANEVLPAGAPVVLELSGTQSGLEVALRLAAAGARVGVVGVLPRLTEFELFRPMQDKGITLVPIFRSGGGRLGGAGDPTARYLEAALDMVAVGRVEVRSLATHVVPWRQAPDALAQLRARPDAAIGLAFSWDAT